jgi:hypothetical protein
VAIITHHASDVKPGCHCPSRQDRVRDGEATRTLVFVAAEK